MAGLFRVSRSCATDYFATRSLDSEVPIELNTVIVCEAEVTWKNLSVSLAQYLQHRDVGSPPVSTWIV